MTEADSVDDARSKGDLRNDVQSVVRGLAHQRSRVGERGTPDKTRTGSGTTQTVTQHQADASLTVTA